MRKRSLRPSYRLAVLAHYPGAVCRRFGSAWAIYHDGSELVRAETPAAAWRELYEQIVGAQRARGL